MSQRLKTMHNFSNEEVIDDLTKDLELSLCAGEIDSKEMKKVDSLISNSSPGSQVNDFQPSTGDSGIETNFGDIPLRNEDQDKTSQSESDKEDSDTDSIDSLKDAELVLTDDQKEERRIIAEELKTAGNEAFKLADFERCIKKYTEALRICPLQYSQQRSILYSNRSAAKMKLEKYNKAIKDCTKAIELDGKYLKAYYRRAQSYEATDKLDECLADYQKVLVLDPSHKEAKIATVRLPPMIEERNEKLKTEMFGKLKDLGNMILKPFGLSTENFQLEQDSESKGYKINFKQ